MTVTLPSETIDYFASLASQRPHAEADRHLNALKGQIQKHWEVASETEQKKLKTLHLDEVVKSGEIEHGGVKYSITTRK